MAAHPQDDCSFNLGLVNTPEGDKAQSPVDKINNSAEREKLQSERLHSMKKDGDICLVAPGSAKCLAIASSDTAPVLVSLGAEAVMVGAEGERRIKVEELYRDDGIDYIAKAKDEVLKGLVIPRESLKRQNVYLKLRRRGSFDFPVLGVAATMERNESGECRRASIVLTAVASAPKVITEAATLLCGQKITADLIETAADAAAKASHPLDNADLDYWYRKRMAKVYTQRALASLAGLSLPIIS